MVVSFKTISKEGLKSKTIVLIQDGCICILRRQFSTIETPHSLTLRKVGDYFYIESAISFLPESWRNIVEVANYLKVTENIK